MQLGNKTDPPRLPPQHPGKKPMALVKHELQSSDDKVDMHCARLYNVNELVNVVSAVANFLTDPEYAALSATVLIVLANNSLKRLVSVTVSELAEFFIGSMIKPE